MPVELFITNACAPIRMVCEDSGSVVSVIEAINPEAQECHLKLICQNVILHNGEDKHDLVREKIVVGYLIRHLVHDERDLVLDGL